MGLDKVEEYKEGAFYPIKKKKHLRIKCRVVQSDPVYALEENIEEKNKLSSKMPQKA